MIYYFLVFLKELWDDLENIKWGTEMKRWIGIFLAFYFGYQLGWVLGLDYTMVTIQTQKRVSASCDSDLELIRKKLRNGKVD